MDWRLTWALLVVLRSQEAYLQQSLITDSQTGLTWSQLSATIPSNRVFRIAFNPTLFFWSEGNFGGVERPVYRYTPSLQGKASLPNWIHYKYSERHKAGFIFGVPPEETDFVELDVLAQNQMTMEYGLLKLSINVTDPESELGQNAVQLKVDNLNMEDMFDAHRLKNLKEIFTQNLWPDSQNDLHLTSIGSAVDFGFRHPADPNLKDGVVVHLGSAANFSEDMTFLEQEVTPLRGFPNCPRDFKRTSVERFFREKGFALDWCHFRLLQYDARWNKYYELGQAPDHDPEDVNDADGLDEFLYEIDESLSTLNVTNGTFIIMDGNLTTLGESPEYTESQPESVLEGKYHMFFWFLVAGGVLIFLVICCMCLLLCCSCRSKDENVITDDLEVEQSMGLVLSDCFTCCTSRKKIESPHSKAEREFQARMRNDPRFRRASSVQRQTDTIRRLAQQRCVTPKLHSPTNQGPTDLYPPLDEPMSNPTTFRGYNELADGGPIILMSDDESPAQEELPSLSHVNYRPHSQPYHRQYQPVPSSSGSRPGTLNRRSYYDEDFESMDPLGSLKRPAPPSYGDENSTGRLGREHATYLV
ncbi:hypothetical protein TCAL_06010 [Tigriopus californicus]|uniref:Dystroglycan-type cadherin-like domain-containing protein n=1 Tax=Tigriopus californicus TaxID=6832 RepID=A0A553PP12_TIGCA|nr:uncharacterized protein LOC131881624 [Tigriopus californicus]TRY79421.1 hypothetical protein TCAL_06010 [Tigriopus californicus]|eukprot:TCALIF_06010-PA protein Name:"Similar to SGCE Epsilon-sarcoglycan (Pongo abelii)" AED:0.14 eAED:0.14 QI:1077/1/0.5/1/1/1/2/0/585